VPPKFDVNVDELAKIATANTQVELNFDNKEARGFQSYQPPKSKTDVRNKIKKKMEAMRPI